MQNNRLADVKSLLKQGADPDEADDQGYTPLIIAAREGYNSIARALIEYKADINKPDRDGNTPLIWSVTNTHAPSIQTFLDAGADTDKLGMRGTALMCAAGGGHGWIVRLLLDKGANPHIRDAAGNTAYSLAEKKNMKATMQMLKEASSKHKHQQVQNFAKQKKLKIGPKP